MDRVGRYVIDRKIGTGGMGTVYLAHDEETGRPAAVKVLPASLAREEGFLLRFEREIAALRQLDNPNVVKIYESGAVGGEGLADSQAYYYAMEYVDGETLLAKLRRERRLPWPTVIDYSVQICAALKAAHDAGIIHRDLKPSNLLVSNDGQVKLADFGVAQVFASTRLTKTGGIIGTAEFMSPEQAQGQRATKKSDLYSLGAVMYTMLAGKPPYSGQTMLDVLHKHRFGQYDRPRHYAPDSPSWLEEIVVQLLEKDPEKRPADAYVTGKRLREVLKKVELSQSEPLPGRASGAGQPPGPPTGQEILSSDDHGGHASEYDADAPTRTAYGSTARDAPTGPRGPGEATIMHALIREEIARQQELHPVRRFFENTWVLIGLLVLLLVGGWFWYQSLPTPEWHLAEARRIIEGEPEGPIWTTARREHLEPLLEEEGEWPERAKELLAKVEDYERRRPLPRKLTRPSESVPIAVAASVPNEPSRLLRRAELQRDAGDVVTAVATLQALLAVTEGQHGYATEHARAKRLLGDIEKTEADHRTAFIRASLTRAEALTKDGKPAGARKIYRSLLTLYGDDPAAKDLLQPAREALHEQSTADASPLPAGEDGTGTN
jgi:serine/threonine-protein kinase